MKNRTIAFAGLITWLLLASNAVAQLRKGPLPPPSPIPITPAPPGIEGTVEEEKQRAYALARGLEGPEDIWIAPGPNAAAGVLVVPKDGLDPKGLNEIEEDLKVMAHILEKAVGRDDKGHRAMGIWIQNSVLGSPAIPRNLYLDGYGAVFLLNVNFPLEAPSGKRPEVESKEDPGSEWEEARRELYHGPGAGPGIELNLPGLLNPKGLPTEEYDADKVEQLKRNVINALKNASHIRGLKSDETVSVIVNGRSGMPGSRIVIKKVLPGRSGQAFAGHNEMRGSKMVLRAKRADIEAFQKERLNSEEFRKKVTILLY